MKKNIIALIMGIISLNLAGATAIQQNPPVNASFKALGNCEMCKARIEQALDVPGIKKVVYLTTEQLVQVQFNVNKISLEQIQRLVSQAGHDTELFKASDQVYQTLPGCCRYREGACHDHSGN